MTQLYDARRLAYEQAHIKLAASHMRSEELIERLMEALP
jgi:hypothetical protein